MKKSGKGSKKPILISQHAPHEHPAILLRLLKSLGIKSQWIHPYRGDAYPKASQISGIISLGGPMGANDEEAHSWIRQECQLLRQCVEKEMPVVGICLGGQMLAKAMGARVERNSQAEVGWFPIRLNPEGQSDPVLGGAGPNPVVYHWHADTFHLPKTAVLLAESQACERQAYRIGEHAYGFQFHPEADHQLVMEWLDSEGVEDDIQAARRDHGTRTVQDSKTQRSHAAKGEKASLKITAGIGALLGRLVVRIESDPLESILPDELETLFQNPLTLEFEGIDRETIRLRGTIATILTIQPGKFLIFQDENLLLWPIRIDRIKKLMIS